MKKTTVLALALAAIGFSACKKDRTCTCTSQVISQTSTDPNYVAPATEPPTTNTTKFKKVKKNNPAVEQCVSMEQTNTYNSSVYENGTYTTYQVTEVSKQDCTLK